MKILIICDSHGSNYGVESYSSKISKEYDTEILSFPGLSLSKINNELCIDRNYNIGVLQLGNPDIHPRMPKRFIDKGKKLSFGIVRDSLFSIPPKLSMSFIIRFPFFLIRLLVIRLMKKKEYYTNEEDFYYIYTCIYKKMIKKCEKVIIIPTFEVNETIYGPWHNRYSKIINTWLVNKFNERVLEFNNFNNKNFNIDFFHFNDYFHLRLYKELKKKFEVNL